MMHGAQANIVDTIGNTPIVKLNSVTEGLVSEIYAKLEFLNPGGSVKDRPALQIIDDAEANGTLVPGGTIVEATSGNTGLGLAIARELARNHGGDLSLVGSDENGTEFRLTLPAS